MQSLSQPIFISINTQARSFPFTIKSIALLKPSSAVPTTPAVTSIKAQNSTVISPALYNTLKVLEWDKLCDSVSSFAGTSLGRQATKAQLLSLNQTYQESLRLLDETNAALEMHNGGFSLHFDSIDAVRVKSAIQHAQRDLPVDGPEALAVASLLQFADDLQLTLRAAIKKDSNWHRRFMPLTEVIWEFKVNRTLLKSIMNVIDEDGSVKDSASAALRRSREQVQIIERKLSQLMANIIRNEIDESSYWEVSNTGGRWCLRSNANASSYFKGLLLSSGSGNESIMEPLIAVPINDELQQARALVAKAEEEVLSTITKKMQMDLDDVKGLLNSIVQLDVINARATYGLSYGGTCPDLFLFEKKDEPIVVEAPSSDKETSEVWRLFLPKAHHPLLLQQHRQNLENARKEVNKAAAEFSRRKMQPERVLQKVDKDIDLPVLKEQVAALEQACPVPVDFSINWKTRVVVITGPNTGGKTVCLKTVGLAAMMARSGLHVLASESAQIPWFDYVFADIGDEQSLSQSLSTFSGHLKQISDIQSQSTTQSLVLLDEVGAGTNPLEGAALGMSILESFAKSAFLTIATTHHGELKTLKYSNNNFENACMEFDEVNLKPTYKILWGVPGRSNAINIAERLGLPRVIINNAREAYGEASAEINEVIVDMERFKQESRDLLHEADRYMMFSRMLYEKLLNARRKIHQHGINQRRKKMHRLSEAAAMARSAISKKVQQLHISAAESSQTIRVNNSQNASGVNKKRTEENRKDLMEQRNTAPSNDLKQILPEKKMELPRIGDLVHVVSVGRNATVLKVDVSKNEIVVQAGNMKLKLKLGDISR